MYFSGQTTFVNTFEYSASNIYGHCKTSIENIVCEIIGYAHFSVNLRIAAVIDFTHEVTITLEVHLGDTSIGIEFGSECDVSVVRLTFTITSEYNSSLETKADGLIGNEGYPGQCESGRCIFIIGF